jgi:hypothetical protein
MYLKITVDTLDQDSCAQLAAIGTALAQTPVTPKPPEAPKPIKVEKDPVEKDASKKLQTQNNEGQPDKEDTDKRQPDKEAADKRPPEKESTDKEDADKEAAAKASGASTPVKRTAKKVKAAPAKKSTITEEAQETPTGVSPEEVTKEMLQTVIRSKGQDDATRKLLKKELDKYGAKNISTLEEKDYADFYQFMGTL